MRKRGIIGVDPGVSGAVSWLNRRDRDDVIVVPFAKLTDRAMLRMFLKLADDTDFAVLELVHSMPRDSSKAAFTFGQSLGKIMMALTCAKIRFDTVPPQVWQRKLKCLTKGNKKITHQKAERLFPGVKITHKVADALLLAEYGRRFVE